MHSSIDDFDFNIFVKKENKMHLEDIIETVFDKCSREDLEDMIVLIMDGHDKEQIIIDMYNAYEDTMLSKLVSSSKIVDLCA